MANGGADLVELDMRQMQAGVSQPSLEGELAVAKDACGCGHADALGQRGQHHGDA
jgi:hypothetical protein